MRTADVLRSAQPPLRRFWWPLLAGLGTAVSAIALLAASAWLITRSAEQPAVMYITAVVVAVRAFALGRGVFRYLERLSGHDAALGQLAGVRAALVRRIVPLAPDGLGGARRGALLSRLVDDVDELQNLPLRVVMPLAVAGLASVASVVFTAFLSPVAALALAACLIVAFALAVWIGGWAGARAERSIAPLRSRLTDALVDEFTGLDVLTAFDATDAAHARVRSADAALRRATVRRAGAQGLTSGAVSLLAGVASLATLLVAAPLLGQGGFTGPALAVVVLLPMAVFEVFGPVPLALASWRQVRTAAERIAETVPDGIPAGLPRDEPVATGHAPALGSGLHLRGVGARWPARPGSPSAEETGRLVDIDLDVAPGERVLVTGPSGAGKTTLAHVLVRFLDHTGSYRIGDTEVRELNGDDLRRTIGLCEQSPYLFDESLRQNLIFARDTATDDELWAVLQRVGLAKWARERGGLDADLGERGALVSGGQAQRIALARAVLAEFPVLVLDEPTAGVDPAASDALLLDLLGAIDGRRAVVLISHVEVPAGLVDREVRMEAGRLTQPNR
ncbi:thiol reductant ABC exporter subunit CydC [Microbacterium caowuchunii]|uniref:thiol reductant ABC exporter subunit CydC n=1 Tax=Microbacterium caowuchunii TaxID=2614638 RepID=UPI001244C9A8|nr:thiol reductant ABC exporter subunit CydC [Microbacterium caowuchunii]QEV99278.1 thiol reductant ABC exporter subunit CydC [Microbacterium caowuchunii]